MFAFHPDAGLLALQIVGLIGGVAMLEIGQRLFARFRSPWSCAVIAAISVAPAGVVGWCPVCGLFPIVSAGEPWHSGFAWVSRMLIAGIAWVPRHRAPA